MKEKFWTSKDGMLGTAHRNREGREVDFRPSSSQELEVIPGRREMIRLQAPRGVVVPPFRLPATLVASEVKEEGLITSLVRETWRAEFRGARVDIARVVKRLSESTARAALEEEGRQRRVQWLARNYPPEVFAQRRAYAWAAFRLRNAPLWEILALSRPTDAEWDTIMQSPHATMIVAELLTRAMEALQGEEVPEDFLWLPLTEQENREGYRELTEVLEDLRELWRAEMARRRSQGHPYRQG